MMHFIAQFSLGNDQSLETLNNAATLTQETANSWQRVWDSTISPTSPLWKALIGTGILIAAIGLLYMGFRQGKEIMEKGSWADLIEMLLPPILVGIFFAGNGYILAHTTLLTRAIGYGQLNKIYSTQIEGVSLQGALQAIQQTNLADTRAKEIFSDCIGKSGKDLETCMSDPAKLKDLQDARSKFNKSLSGNLLDLVGGLINPTSVIDNVGGAIYEGVTNNKAMGQIATELFASPFITIAQTLLYALQWGVVNGIEASLFLMALMGPIAVGLSIIPMAGRYIYVWMSGFLGLFAVHLSYAILVGVCAVVINFTAASSQTFTYLLCDLAFLVFIAFIAPRIANTIGKEGGTALYQGISRAGTELVHGSANATATIVSVAARFLI